MPLLHVFVNLLLLEMNCAKNMLLIHRGREGGGGGDIDAAGDRKKSRREVLLGSIHIET
jgi:hypothetical protein